MDRDYLVKAYIYIIASLTIGIAIYNIMNFFGGVGLSLVGFSVLLILAVRNILKSGEFKKRFGDIYALIVLEALLMLILFFVVDYRTAGEVCKFALVLKNIISIYSIIALVYVLFRFFSELNGKKFKAVEYMLGNYTPAPKEPKPKKVKPSKAETKKNKELENGTLAPKPSSMMETASTEGSVEEEDLTEQVAEPSENQQNEDNYTNNWY